MKKTVYILLIFLVASPLLAQNVFFGFSDGRFQEIIPLQTDSMYIVGGTQTREISLKYDANHRIILSRDRRIDTAQNSDVRETSARFYYPDKFIFIDTTETFLPFQSIFISRNTLDSLDGRIISDFGELWNGTAWQGVQKDSFRYDPFNHLIERSAQSWDFVDLVWKYQFFEWYDYDPTGLLDKRRALSFGNSVVDTLTYNEFYYTYNAQGDITSRLWKNGSQLLNISRETFIYDNNGNLDSLKVDYWNTVLQVWWPDNIYTLDDSPEQQITQIGKNFKFNSQSQWYLDSEAFYTVGPQIYTDQPAEVLVKVLKSNTNQLENYERQRTTYTDLPDGIIKGEFQRAFFINGNWQNALQVEAWMRKIESVDVNTPEVKAQAPSCGLPNPVAISDLPIFLSGLGPAQQLEVFSMDGRLVLSKGINNDILPENDIRQTGVYWLLIRGEANIICAQKVLLY